jgi:hypothetical protein
MSKFIIDIRDDIGDYEAIQCLMSVLASGRISGDGRLYCYHTEFCNGIHVSVMEKRKGSSTDKFIIHLNNKK